ncbi:PucR family transcriptional regulator [Paraburkholderia sp. EG287A]|uniref:PucR family transcriptional regulator n=1 Tax=unclassified Paraburkholderia TaxID=2615204 RepID=UPI0034D26798
MTVAVPEISPALREWTEKIARDHTEVIDRVYKTLSIIKPYADLDAPTRLDIRHSIGLSLGLWLDTLLSGSPPSEQALEDFQDYGRRRVYQGVPLESLLRAFRLGSRELWCHYIELDKKDEKLRDELLFQVSPYLMEFSDTLAQAITQIYLEEQYKQARWRESLRYQLLSIILNFPDETERFSKAAAALNLDAKTPRMALAFDIDSVNSDSPTFKSEIDPIVAATARRLKLPVDEIFDIWFRGQLVMWIPARVGELMGTSVRQAAGQIANITDAFPQIKAIGIGLPGEGAAGWAMSADEASKALRFDRRRDDKDRVRLYSEIAVEESIRGTDRALGYLVSLVEQLASEPDLLETLRTYFDQLQRRKVTASVLGIHPNTLNHRLGRIETILGARLDESGWIAKLDIALKLYAP